MACALYDNTATPDRSSAAIARYGAGGYAAGEQSDGAGWPAGGWGLFNTVPRLVGDLIVATADPVASIGPVTVGPHGSMIYDQASTIPAAGLACAFHHFGGLVASRAGQFTVLWSPDGVAVMAVPQLTRTP